jgi:glucose/arabinose dehydrogenase
LYLNGKVVNREMMSKQTILSLALLGASLGALSGCGGGDGGASNVSLGGTTPTPTPTATATPVAITGVQQTAAVATFDTPWAMTFLPDGRMLVTQRNATGALSVVTTDGLVVPVTGLPDNIGVLDVELSPDYASTGRIFFSYMIRDLSAPRVGRAKDEPTLFPERMAVARARLVLGRSDAQLQTVQVVFQQDPTIVAYVGSGEPGGRLAFSPSGQDLYITSGDRQELDKTFLFSTTNTLGKIIRIHPDGSIPADNPFVGTAGAKGEIWTLGHRNHYGLAFAPDGQLWSSEMGPKGGDELNLVKRGLNYGWPAVSNGDNYDGSSIPDHAPGDGFEAPKVDWTPVIAPSGMIFYSGNVFADWKGDILITGLQSHGIVRVRTAGETAKEVQRVDLGTRIREIEQGPDGALWVLTDGKAGELRKLTPVF